ncbi:MAG: cation-translocating P-type ATPase [Promethearchaeota archaeon]|nr:MAG: cation-translocating P-type ATPase [Candidatus Lokiarchaeota archaeon]
MSKSPTLDPEYYAKSIENIIKELDTDKRIGLNENQIKQKIEKFGYNELPEVKRNLWRIYLAPIFNFLILILIIAGIAIVILGSPSETIITFTVVFINSATAIIQQYRAQKALDSLQRISALRSTVIRNGEQTEIPSREIVPGDLVLLDQGSKIPADGRILDSINLSINEAPLTGESEPVEKKAGQIDEQSVSVQDQYNMVFMGTYVNTGRGKILITKTGQNTEIGTISESLNKMGSIEEIPLTKKLNKLGYILGTIVLINLIILIIYKLTLLGQPVSSALTDSILRAMNIMPINLPLLVTLVLITGVLNMAQSGVIIKNLSAIESLGRVSVICTDKTGTITKNEMTVEEIWINNNDLKVSGSGYNPEGKVYDNNEIIKYNHNKIYSKLIDSMILNNNAKLVYEDVKIKKQNVNSKAVRKALGSPTEAALLVLTEKFGVITYDIRNKYEVLVEYPFSSEIKRMTTVCKHSKDSNIYVFSKGAPEIILDLSEFIEINGKRQQLDENFRKEIINKIETKGSKGYRNLAIAYNLMNSIDNPKAKERKEVEQDLTFLGFVSIIDPPREGVKEAIQECKSANIKISIITGDHPSTAKTIASEVGIYEPNDLVIKGNEIKEIDEINFDKISVFARVEPSDKEIIVKRYQKDQKIVAMTGDGVNDSLALKLANCGIAMGITGTDVAKDVSDMVISDDNFTSIKNGVEIGRGLFSRIRTIIYFFICLNLMEGLIFFSYEFFPFFDLFSSNWQHIYIFGVVHSLPSLALVLDKFPKNIMKEPPRNDEEILNKNMWKMLALQAFLIGVGLILVLQITLAGWIPLNQYNLDPTLSYIPIGSTENQLIAQKARTMFISTLYITEIIFIWTIRRPNQSLIKSIRNEFSPILFIIGTFTLLIHVLLVIFSYPVNSFINDVIKLNFQLNFLFLSFGDWVICILCALPGVVGIEIYKYYFRKKGNFF